MRIPSLLLAAPLLLSACAGSPAPPGDPTPPLPVSPPAAATAPANAPATVPAPAPAPAAAAAPVPASCGALGCLLFDTPAQAFARVLESEPRVLAIGESHAQQGSEGIPSATRRFTEIFLPMLAGRASDLIVELWVADPSCNKQQVAQVAREQQAVTQSQAQGNQSEFVTLGHEARRLGVVPHVLRPSCAEYDAILRAGDASIDAMLTMIARLTAVKAKQLLAREAAQGKLVVAYGGALHNDLAPRPGREPWSFGPELHAHTGGKYIELDIIIREFIKDTESWKALPWYPHFDRDRDPDRAVLFNPAPGSYVLIFPRST